MMKLSIRKDVDHKACQTIDHLIFESPLSDVLAKVFSPRGGVDLKGFVRIVGEIHLVKYLRRFVLNGLYLHLMRRIFALTCAIGDLL